IILTQALPALSGDITITGPGANLLTVSRDNTPRSFGIFSIKGGATAAISGLTISNGFTGNAGGGITNAGTLTLTDCTITGNKANYDGGGIYNSGTLTLTDCTVTGNKSTQSYAGGIFNSRGGTLTLTNCTVSGNKDTNGLSGGGIFNS